MTTQYGFFIDSSRCTGCKTCELACKDYKDLTPDVSFRRIYEYAGGDWQEDNGVWHQNVFAYYLSISCNHCEDPACTKVCPSGAMHKRDDGFVRRRYKMGSGWHEWPLMIFTVFGQCVAGGFIVLALALMKGDLRAETQQRVIACMFGLWVLMGIGFIASMLHLGSPMRAFNSLNRVGASALSNEIASGSVFFAVGGIGWLLAVLKKLPPALRTLWLIITMVLGVVFVWMMVRVYNSIDTVPTWYSVWTPLGFFLTLFMGGPLLGYLLLRIAGVNGWAMRLLPAVSVLALVVIAIMVAMQGAELATIHSSIQQASALVPDYGSLMAWRMVLLAAALCCWIVPQLKGYQPAVPLLSVAFILMLAGELIGRGVFYGLHMTVGMAVAS
ncbi:dimethyl sulfoxide reductase [Salmonella enterica subsp. enterica serovar Derby]|nr:dimethyl sulfoxide reductase [Salmonella enterica subsp. enterica serovar Derby]